MHDTLRLMSTMAAKRHGVISLAEARGCGASSMQLHRWVDDGWVARLGRRNFVFPGQPETFRQRLLAALNDAGATAVASHQSAALLHKFDGFTCEAIELTVPRCRRSITIDGLLHSSAVPLIDRCQIEGFACTTPARTIIDLSAQSRMTSLENAVDTGIRSGGTSAQFLAKRLAGLRGSGRSGVRLLDSVLLDAGGANALERRFLRLCRLSDLPRPKTQVTYRASGKVVARVDFDFGELIVEVDGQISHSSPRQRQHDAARRRALSRLGRTVYTFTYQDVFNRPADVMSEVRAVLQRI